MGFEFKAAGPVAGHLPALIDLLIDAVEDGASLGFLRPLGRREAAEYWRMIQAELDLGTKELIVAFNEGSAVGAVQLALAAKANARHRAEVQKLMVHTRFRNRGLATGLMAALEARAAEIGRRLIVLDTRKGDPASRLYDKLGYVRFGEVPGYTVDRDGRAHGTVFYYKHLPSES